MSLCSVNESIREISDNCWVIGGKILLTRAESPLCSPSWSDGKGSFYNISEAASPVPPSRPLSTESCIRKVYEAGGASAVWVVGDAICKVKVLDPHSTREHTTLQYLHDKQHLSFPVPKVYYHTEHDNRYYIIQSRLSGETLSSVWSTADDVTKQQYVTRVVDICQELAIWRADNVCGVDGKHLSDLYLTRRLSNDCSPTTLLRNCKELEMDCSEFLFYHCDLGPGNIIVNTTDGTLGLIDWETAGFVPREWIRTKFRVSGGLDLPGHDHDSRGDWRRRVQRHLEKEGFPDIAETWMTWWKNEM
jgi:serine/threonine protein kinase